ncbi:T9SS type B sorting domain-containing protein [Weeksellaceae bacterium KMM 9713]|uniref:T9SS type B sorting domain-containing protein n=1 Tax=Profundicola chukchiensis TaxID=2961959 RepID=A0A9X4MWH5_9FLAO|nr:T9SS type B sorting domain-containing protein [Profundicola chukchiensis]MDG4946163.1 T9SS type B sorting domain-containing protein [Profundicola chukchiensis]
MSSNLSTYHLGFVLTLFLIFCMGSEVNAQVPTQTICTQDAMSKSYKVDWEENGGEGTAGSIYSWEILEGSYNDLIQPTTGSGNQIEIDWSTVPVGTYTLLVTETTQAGCFNQEELEVILENCDCDNPVTVNIDEIEPICEGQTIQLSVEINNATTVQWSTEGDGNFDDNTSFTPIYTPGLIDIANGNVILYVVTEDPDGVDGVCDAGNASVELIINSLSQVDMSSVNVNHCLGSSFELPTSVDGVSGTWQDEEGEIVTQLNTSTIDDDLVYTFIPDDDQGCYVNSTVSFEIEALIDLSFVGLPDENVCNVADLPMVESLPNSSEQGVAGAWTQEDNQDGTYTYSFTPTDTCYNEYSFIVTLTEAVDTEFVYTDSSVCDVAELPIVSNLNSQDNNGVEGVWTVNQVDDVYTYTFTPSGGCYNEYSFVVTVTSSVDTVFTYTDNSVCDVADLPLVDNLATEDNNGVNGTWTVSQVDEVYTYTFTPSGGCYNEFVFTVTITETVATEFTYVDSSVCDVADLPIVDNLQEADNNGVNGTWSVNQVDDVYTYTFTPTDSCYNEFSFVITVTSSVDTVFDYTDSSVCDVAEIPDVSTLAPQDNNGVAGTWTVMQTGDVYAYTFTPIDSCFNEFSFTVTVSDSVDTVFDYTDIAVCDVTELPEVSTLDSQDNNGIEGSWSVDQSDDIYTYTFTPTDSCYNEYTFTVTVTESVDTDFTYVDSTICDVGELPNLGDLATQDDNGVDGAWSVNQIDDVYTYTFTPIDSCYNEFSFTVTISDSVATIFDYMDLSVCDAAEIPDVSTLVSQDNNGVDGTWSVNQVDDVYTYTFTPSGGCYNVFVFTVTVTDSVDTEFDYTDSSVCDVADLPLVDNLATEDNNGVAGTWTVAQTGDDYTYTFTPSGGCFNEYSFVVTVTSSVDTVFDYTDSSVCDAAELPEISTLDSQDNNGVAGTWSVNQVDDVYTYTFTPTDTCYNEFSFTVTVSDSVDTEFTYTDSAVCDATNLPEVGDLVPQDNNVVDGTWSVSQVDDVYTYTFTPIDSCYNEFVFTVTISGSVDTMFTYTDSAVCNAAELPEVSTLDSQDNNGVAGTWSVSQVEDVYTYTFTPTDTCYNEFSFTVTVSDSVDTEFTYTDSSVCDVEELPEVGELANLDNNGIDGTWTVNQVDDVYTYIFTPFGGCYNIFTFVVTVTSSVDTEFTYTDSAVCDVTELPEVSTLDSQDNNGVAGTWSVNQVDEVYTYTFTPSGGCYNEFVFTVTVTDSVDTEFDYTDSSVCDVADLPLVDNLETEDNNGVAGTWSVSQVDDVYTYTFTATDSCYNEFSFTVTISGSVDTVFTYTDSSVCDVAELPDVSTLGSQDNNGVAGTWTVTQAGDVYTYTFTPIDSCYNEFSFTVTISDSVDTVFTYIDSAVCDTTDPPEVGGLQTQDNNGVAGTWSVNQFDEVYTYTFTPIDTCFNEFTFVVTVTSSVDTVFEYTDSSVCDAAELPEVSTLDSQDNNGVDGTWSVNQVDDVYNYTFTPTDSCYNEFSFTVTISDSVDAVFTYTDSAVCDVTELPEVSTLDSQDNNGVDGTWTVNQVDDIYTYTFTPIDICYNEYSFTVTVTDSVATIFDYTDYSVCDVADLPEVATLASQDNNGVAGTWSVNQVDDVYTYTFTPTEDCYNEFTFTVTVTVSVDTEFDYADSSVCDVAEIPEVGELATQDDNAVDGTWSVSQVDDVHTYTFTPTDSCYNEFSFTVTVSDSVDSEFDYTDLSVCDVAELPEVGDLSTQDYNGVAGTWAVSQVDDIYTYTFTPTDTCYNEFIFTVTVSDSVDTEFTYTNNSACDIAELPEVGELATQDNNGVDGTWSMSQVDGVNTYTFTPTDSCYNEFSFTVTVSDSVDSEFTYTDSSVCDVADLPEVSTLDSQDNNGVDGTWSMNQVDDVYTYTFTPTDTCYNEFSFTVTISDSVDTEFTYTDSAVCDVTELPEVPTLDPQDNNGVAGTWSVSQVEDVYTYTFTPIDSCYNEFTFTVTVSDSVDAVFTYTDSAVCDVTNLPAVTNLNTQDNNGVDGTWSVNQVDGVYTYTFTPTDSCYNEFSFTVTISDSVDTVFTYTDSAVCDVTELPEVSTLDPQDNNGVNGTWSVSQVEDVYTYTFTPIDSCYNEFTFTVTVSDSVDAVFTYTDSAVCDVTNLPAVTNLNTQDNNGVDGTWSVNQVDGVYTYTFTPTEDCYNEFIFTVTVSESVDTVFTYTDSAVCDVTELPDVGELAAQDINGVQGTWSVEQVDDVYTYTFTPTGDCYNEFTFTVTVSDSVDSEFTYTDSSVCDVADLLEVGGLQTNDNNGVTGTWTVAQTGDVYTYTFTPTDDCYNEYTFTVTLTDSVATEFTYVDLSICDIADLPMVDDLEEADNNGVEGVWTVNQVDDVYTYTFTPTDSCFNEFTFVVTVTSSIDTVFDYSNSSVCDATEIPDVSTLAPQDNNGIDGAWTVAQTGDEYTYTFTPSDTCYNEFVFTVTLSDSVATIFDYTGSSVCDVADLPMVDNLQEADNNGVAGTWSVDQVDGVYTYTFTSSGGCYNEFTFVVTVTSSVDTEFNYTDSSVCDVAGLPVLEDLAIQDNNGIDGTWSMNQDDDDYTYTFTPTGGCYNEFSFTVTITETVDTEFTYVDASVCDVADLPLVDNLATEDNNGVAGTWSMNQVDDVYTYTFTPTEDCYNEFAFTVTVTDSVATEFDYIDLSVCDGTELPGVSTLDPQDNNGVDGTWSVSQVEDVYTYTFTPTDSCFNEFTFVVTVTSSVDTVFDYTDSSVCDVADLPLVDDLETEDNNGVDGAWTVNQVDDIYTYTFTPSGGCFNEYAFTVTFTESADTEFGYVDASVCDVADLPLVDNLVTEDNNGVEGTWLVSQVDDVYTYTFTPTDSCYNEFSFVITLTSSVDTVFDYTDSSICDAAELPIVSNLNPQDNNGVDGTWSVNQVDEVYTYTFTPMDSCFNEFSFTVTMTDSVATIFDYTDYSVCDVTELPEVSTLDSQDNNGVDGTWSMNQVEDIYTYTFTPTGDCYNEFTFAVTVSESVDTVFTYTDSAVCDAAELPEVLTLDSQDNNGVDGTWSVAQVDEVYTYTFTPIDTCYNEFTFTVTVSDSVDAVFTYTDSAVCDVTELPEVSTLDSQDNNGVDGTWAVSQVGDIYTYTFTPTGDCYNDFTFTVTVTDSVDTEFDYTDSSVCDVAEIPDVSTLDSQDNNGVAGTWSVNQVDDVYTYTFTPPGGCYNEYTFTVTITETVVTEFNYVDASVCDVADLPLVDNLATEDNNGVAGTWTVAQIGDDYTYTFTPSGGCYNEFVFTVTVSDSVDSEFTYVDASVCDVADLPMVEDLEEADNNGVEGVWTVNQVDDVYTYTFTPSGGCYNEFSFVVTVTSSVDTVFDYTDLSVCDVAEIPDVSTLDSLDNNGVEGTWRVAQAGDIYTYTFTPTGDCYNEFTFTVTVTDSVDTDFDYTDSSVCAASELPEVGGLETTDNNGVEGAWSVDQVDDVHIYTFTPSGGCYNEFTFVVSVTSSVDTVFTYIDSAVCDVTELPDVSTLASQDNNGVAGTWSVNQVDDVYTYTFTPTDSCYNEFSFTVTISDSVDTVFTYTDSSVCDVAELPEVSTLDSQDNNGVAGTWSVNQVDEVYTYTFTPSGGCYNEYSFVVTVTSSVDTVFDYTDASVCDAAELPIVSNLNPQDNNGVAGTWLVNQVDDDYTYTFTPTDSCYNEFAFTVTVTDSVDTVFDYTDSSVCDAAEIPEVSTLDPQDNNGVDGTWSVNQVDDVYTYTFTPSGGCYNEYSFVVTVTFSVDTVFDYIDLAVCDTAELPVVSNLNTQDNNGVDGTWSVNQVDDVYTYTFTPTDSCFNEFTFVVTVTSSVDTVFDYTDYSVCDVADLSLVDDLDPQDNNGVEGTWTVTQAGDVYIYTFTPTDTCYNEFSFDVNVIDAQEVSFNNLPTSSVCDTADLPRIADLPRTSIDGATGTWTQTNNGNQTYTYEFTLDENQNCYIGTSFTVQITDSITPEFSFEHTYCQNSSPASLPQTSDNGITGQWLPAVINTAFTNMRLYTFVPHEGQCASSVEVMIEIIDCPDEDTELNIPNVITPNNDGMNDTWFVDGLIEAYPNAKLEIYNRYNKLLYQGIGAENCEWNGTYAGRALPSGSYWYVLKLADGKVKTGHITIIYP